MLVVNPEAVIVANVHVLETYHRYPDNPTPLSVAADHVNVIAHVVTDPLVGVDNTGSVGLVISRYPVSVLYRYSLPVDKVT